MGPFDHRLPASGAPVMVAPIRGQLTIVRREYLVISGSRRIPLLLSERRRHAFGEAFFSPLLVVDSRHDPGIPRT